MKEIEIVVSPISKFVRIKSTCGCIFILVGKCEVIRPEI
jgi:hypothetical protein